MNFAERAFRYLFRKKGKAIILFWVLLITETMILSTVTILRASEVARIELLGKSKAKLLIEREKAEELFTDDEYKKLEKLENVKAVNRVAEVQLYPMDFKIITKSESVDADNQKLRIMAYDSLEDDGPFADGQIHLTKGKYPRKEGEIVVNQFLAEVNQWEIGETVCFKSHSGEQSQASISGIYISGIEEKQGKEPLAVNRIENTIYNSFETVKEDDVKKIAQVEGIEEYNLITIATVVNPVNFSRIEDSDMDQSTDVGGVNLRGNRIMEMDMDVSAGKISLIEGRMIEKDDRDVCVISKELAELNHLKTGNLLKFNDYHDKEHSTIYSAEIIGIYETKQERKSIMYGDSYRPENTIFTDMSFPEKPSGNEGNPFYQYAIFKVQNAGKYDQVKKSVQKANIDWSRYDLIDNNGNIKNMTENFGQMDQMSMGLLLIVSVSGLVILVLVFLFWIKNRTQEIGIMMSLGKCKFEIWVQFLWEAVMISIIGMLLSFAISPIIAETSASYLAKETQTLRLEQQEQENTGTYIDGYIAPDLKIQDVEVHITKEMVLMDIGMISGILIIAVLVAGITIMKKRPKQILSEMS